ncbi:MAG: DNA-3-methyladenine glycosylase family protein [Pyrinomonadaceae bacterium]
MWKTKSIKTAPNFNFGLTVQSHGWYDLAPFRFDVPEETLNYVFLDGDRVINAAIGHSGNQLKIALDQAVSDKSRISDKVRHVFRLDDDLEEFYGEFCGRDGFEWVRKRGAGRLLRSPTVFEDLVKTMCTTNCSWGLTRKMVENLVNLLGEKSKGGSAAFPTVEAMAAENEKFYREEIRAGYRSPYFVELAEAVASKQLDPESWMHSELPTAELKKEIKSVKGIGDYAAENLLKLLGRYDGLALDSWLRGQFYKKHNAGKKCSDKKINKRYAQFGDWKGLAIWCDMTAHWHAE